MADSTVVFRGTVVARDVLPVRADMGRRNRYAFTFRLEEYWKGSPNRTAVLYGVDPGADCLGDEYIVGRQYLVYASGHQSKDFFLGEDFWHGWTDVVPAGSRMLLRDACKPGGEIKWARKTIRELGKGRVPTTHSKVQGIH
jgi:hypothetical protein